jgi:hypothetical protein
VDGPDIDAHEVDFDELMRRQRRFVEDEKHALNEWLKNIQAPNTASPIEAVSKVDDPSARCAGVNQTDEPAL